jgi:hypothetical protein
MDFVVTRRTERNEVKFGVEPALASEFLVVNFQIRHRAAGLTAPAVAAQDLLAQLLVFDRIQPQARSSWPSFVHDAFSLRLSRKASFWASGRRRKNRLIENSRVSGSPLSRFAPARKSAQIISRQ